MATSFKQALGKLIAALRRERRLSQEKVALEAGIDRTHMGAIERGEANPTIDILEKLAQALGQTLGSLVLQAEDLSNGHVKRSPPTLDPKYIDRTVPLPSALTYEQLENTLNRTLAFLDQLGLNPAAGDIQSNVYSAAVAQSVIRALAETSRLMRNSSATHPALYDPELDPADPGWGMDVIATQQLGKGGESTAPRHGWLMIVVYKTIDVQTQIIQVELALLKRSEWVVHARASEQKSFRSAVTIASATQRLRENSVYLDPEYVTPTIRKRVEARRRAGSS
jgi:transcriptional regulator with XRE-family HTH domain